MQPIAVSDVVGTWSGVRPLLRQEGKKPSEISRRDEVRSGPGPVVAIAGGKLTTYRKMAERVVQAVVEMIRRSDTLPPGASAERPLTGGSAAEQAAGRERSRTDQMPALSDRLWAKYGVTAAGICSEIAGRPSAGERAGGLEELTCAEVEHAVSAEMALSLDDVLRRRSRIGMFDIERACNAAPAVAGLLARQLGWSAERTATEIDQFTRARTADLAAVRAAEM
jgi:glycerol-3-phosphate dehydrogenase